MSSEADDLRWFADSRRVARYQRGSTQVKRALLAAAERLDTQEVEIERLRVLLAPFAAEIEFVEGLADEVMYAEVATVADVRAAAQVAG